METMDIDERVASEQRGWDGPKQREPMEDEIEFITESCDCRRSNSINMMSKKKPLSIHIMFEYLYSRARNKRYKWKCNFRM